MNFDFAVEGIQVGADDVQTNAPSRELGFQRSSGKTRMEQHFPKFSFGKAAGGLVRNETTIDGALFDSVVIDAAAVVFYFDVNVIPTVIGTECDATDVRLAGVAAAFRQFDSVSNRIPDQVNEGIRNLLNDVVVQFGFAAGKVEFHLLAGGFRGVTNGARQSRIQRANGHHARSGDFVLQMVSEFGEFVDIAFDAPDEAAHLREDFVYVGGNLRHGTRENVDVVVTIHFQFAEFRPEGSVARGRVGQHLRRWRSALRKRPTSGIDAIEFVLFLELGDFALQAFFREAEGVPQAL